MVSVPLEIFFGLIGTSIALALFGFIRQPQIPALLTFAGMFIITISVLTTEIEFGQTVSQTNFNSTSGITDYQYEPDSYEFTEMPKVLFALLGAIFMLSGALMVIRFDQ